MPDCNLLMQTTAPLDQLGIDPWDYSKSVAADAARINSERGAVYGDPREDFERTAALWTAILGQRLNGSLTAADVAQLMRLVKESRLAQTPGHRDSLLDLCGYANCQERVTHAPMPRAMDLVDGPTLPSGFGE